MIGIMIKDMRSYAINLIVLGVGLPSYFILVHGRMDPGVIYLMVGYLYLLTLAAMLAAELNESRHRGYEILAVLPVRVRSVVAGKFMLIVLSAAVYTAAMWACFAYAGTEPGAVAMARRLLLINAGLSILVTGGSYLGAFRFGFDRWIWAHYVLMILSFAAPIALNESVERGKLSGATSLGRFVSGIDPVWVCLVSLGIFIALWYAAAAVKEGKDV